MFFLFLIIAFFLEAFVTTFPVVLVVLLFDSIFTQDIKVFLYALSFGLFLDILFLRGLGLTSIYFLASVFLVKAYSSKFEIKTPIFVLISTFIASLIYLLILKDQYAFTQSFIISFFAVLFFIASGFFKNRFLANRF